MKSKIFNIVIAIFLLAAFSSCKKEESMPKQANAEIMDNTLKTSGITLVDGRLVFADSNVFRSYVSWVIENLRSPEVIKSAQREFGFKSFVSTYDEGMKLADSVEFVKYIQDHSRCFKEQTIDNEPFYEMPLGIITSFIANEFGIYQIGSFIICETENYKTAITDGDESKLNKLLLNPKEINDPSITVYDYGTPLILGQYSYKTVYFETKKRIVARMYYAREPYTNYPSYEARTTSQKRGWTMIWVQENITRLGQKNYSGIYWTYNNQYWGTPLLGPFTVDAGGPYEYTNISDIRLPVVVTPGYKAEFTTSSCLCDHWGYRGTTKKQITNNDLFPDNF